MTALSEHCTLAKRPGYEDAHADCRRTDDVPLPHGNGLLLMERCGCDCHRAAACNGTSLAGK